MHFPLLPDIVIILGLSVLIILLFQRLKLPALLGFLITGIVAGPSGLNLIKASHEVELLSEIGIIFLLFVIGIEFSLKGLMSIRNTVFWGGLLQVGGTITITAFTATWMGMPLPSSVFLGFLLALSSTAIVLKMLQERGEVSSPHGRVAVAILIFQDIIVVLMMLMIPLLAGRSTNPGADLLLLFGKLAGILVVLVLLGKYVVPLLFKRVVRAKSRELFLLTTVVLCFATAWLTSAVGLSLALGAFFAGLIISESEYSHQATANILPFREIFISFFFVSVGMLLDLDFFFAHFFAIHALAFAVILLKFSVLFITGFLLRYPVKTVLLASLALFQVGEFSFLLSVRGMEYDLLTDEVYQYFLAVSIISMGATPFVIKYSEQIVAVFLLAPLPPKVRKRMRKFADNQKGKVQLDPNQLKDHVVVIGFGINGENVAKATREAKIPFVVIELDPSSIERAKNIDIPVVYGDASEPAILEHVHIQDARVVVIAISSAEDTKRIISAVRDYSRTVYIIVRTRHLREIETNLALGADEVIPEEFETSIEIFTKVLKKYLVPGDEITHFVSQIRAHNYDVLRRLGANDDENNFPVLHIPEIEIVSLPVRQGNNRIVGKSIGESNLRKEFNVNILAIRRDGKYITRLTPETKIEQDDVLYLFGNPDCVARMNKHLEF
jgi:CPA2 family monovalent cation:H+ antiporter-2